MKLDDFLKVKKVRCMSVGNYEFITVGREYDVVGVCEYSVFIVNDADGEGTYPYEHFEPVLDSAENPIQNAELTPEFEAVEPKFKAGDKVYAPSIGAKIYTLKDVGGDWCYPLRIYCNHDDDYEFTKEGLITAEGLPILFLATELNHALLSQLYPYIDFEQPPKPLTGSDLCFEKLRNGKKLVMCAVSDLSDEKAIKRLEDGDNCIRVINDCDPAPYDFIDTHGIRHGFAVPLNDETGEPLSQAVLDE